MELCGHATLASAFVILNFYEKDSGTVRFETKSGILTVERKGDLYAMDFPAIELREIPVTDDMERAFGARLVRALLGLDLICVFDSEEKVINTEPDQSRLTRLEGRLQNATARGSKTDCVSRSFCPKVAIAEDPVCGSAHVQIAQFWSRELNKDVILAYQASKRGGYLHCQKRDDGRIVISGEAVLVSVCELAVDLQAAP